MKEELLSSIGEFFRLVSLSDDRDEDDDDDDDGGVKEQKGK